MANHPVARIGTFQGPTPKGPDSLTSREMAFIGAMAQGETQNQAATLARVSVRTARRWAHRPEIVAAVRARISEMLATARAVLAAGSARAARSLIAMTDGPGDAVNVAASKAVLEGATKLAAVEEIAAGLAQLEERFARGGRS